MIVIELQKYAKRLTLEFRKESIKDSEAGIISFKSFGGHTYEMAVYQSNKGIILELTCVGNSTFSKVSKKLRNELNAEGLIFAKGLRGQMALIGVIKGAYEENLFSQMLINMSNKADRLARMRSLVR